MNPNLIREIEELSLNAWPALQTAYYDGWILRLSNGYTRRANSIQPLYFSTLELSQKIACCEQIYAARGLPTVFKITPAALPAELEVHLEAAGYTQTALTAVQIMNLHDAGLFRLNLSGETQLQQEVTDGWVDEICRLNDIEARHRSTMANMLSAISGKPCFACFKARSVTVALGLAVVERNYVGLYDIVTAETYRRRGYAHKLILDLLRWARQQGATTAYLQVMCNNSPALRLYGELGFQEAYRYWYRVKV